MLLWCTLLLILKQASSRIVDFEAEGGIPDVITDSAAWHNGRLLNTTLALLQPGDTFLVPNMTFYTMGGVKGWDLQSVVIQLDGTLFFSDNMDDWPREENGDVLECISLYNIENVTFTSSGVGTLDGNGETWWGLPGIGYLVRGENRPRLIEVQGSRDLLFENWFFKNSPYWTFWVHDVDGLEVRHCEISAKRKDSDHHDIIDLTAFNTDGFDVTGKNVWIHDCTVWDQDDCIAVKDGSENMLFERITASGVGLTIGSIGSSVVNNITFRDSYMHHTFKGIYTKFRGDNGRISNVLYENIYIEAPEQWAIWIGPAQQSDSSSLCAAHPCSLCWPQLANVGAECNMGSMNVYENITLRNITIVDPKFSYGQGVIIGSEDLPMKNIVFDGVRVLQAENSDVERYHTCKGVETGVAIGDTHPVPPCFKDLTDKSFLESNEN